MLVKTDMLLTCLLVRPYSVITALEPPKYKLHVHVCLTHKGLISTKKKKMYLVSLISAMTPPMANILPSLRLISISFVILIQYTSTKYCSCRYTATVESPDSKCS